MSNYFIGDIHGCYEEFNLLLNKVNFNPKIDTLWLTGDIIARGPFSLKVIKKVYNLGKSVRLVLGNHEIDLIKNYLNNKNDSQKNYMKSIFEYSEIHKIISWLRYQPILQKDKKRKIIMIHAGIFPDWNIKNTFTYAKEVEDILKSKNYKKFINSINENIPIIWNNKFNKIDRFKFIINVFTRIRYCFLDKSLNMDYKDSPKFAPSNLIPWFSSLRINKNWSIIFGHWSSLMGKKTPVNIYGLDTGCCWGGKLTLLHWEEKNMIQVNSKKEFRTVKL